MENNPHDGHRLRMKHRFLDNGLDGFNPHEVLELLLFYCVPRKDTNPLAHRLINRFGGLPEVLDADFDQLMRVDGVTENVATFLVLMRSAVRRYQQESVRDNTRFENFEQIGAYVRAQFYGERVEKLRMMCLNNRGELLNCSVISEGTLDSTAVNVRGIIETALRYPTTKVILAHNHPAGFAIPSDADFENTVRVRRVLDGIDIQLVDHIVVSAEDYVSMRLSAKYAGAFSRYVLDDSSPDWLR